MKITSVADAKTHLSAYIDQCITEGPIIITRNGKVAVVLIAPTNDEELESLILTHSPRFRALLEKSKKSIEAGQGLTEDAFWSAVEEKNQEGRIISSPHTTS